MKNFQQFVAEDSDRIQKLTVDYWPSSDVYQGYILPNGSVEALVGGAGQRHWLITAKHSIAPEDALKRNWVRFFWAVGEFNMSLQDTALARKNASKFLLQHWESIDHAFVEVERDGQLVRSKKAVTLSDAQRIVNGSMGVLESVGQNFEEDTQSVDIVYVGDGSEDEDHETIAAYRQEAWGLVKASGINILRDKELNSVAVIDGKVCGALFEAWHHEQYSFDVIVSPKSQRQGVGKKLIDTAMSNFRMDSEGRGDNASIKAEVVNKDLIPLLTRMGFKQKATSGGITVMTYGDRSEPIEESLSHRFRPMRRSTMEQISENKLDFMSRMTQAVGRAEVGFYFEEGGCWGMAMALYRKLRKLNLHAYLCVSTGDFIHAFVECEGKFYDCDGEMDSTLPFKRMNGEYDFVTLAKKHGMTDVDVWNAEATARDVIKDAIKGE